MGLYIEGLQLPKKGRHTSITIYSDGRVVYRFGGDPVGQAVPVPDHGRLIDADAAIVNRNKPDNWMYDLNDMAEYLAGCTTIIPAEEGEG